ncbi:2Fe-2S iron-sulfur cluster-binding protein [Streptomyces sp. NBC_00118]|uniref:2Fe-2S iron-sulfur cluster-binding protein n=1 Tax=unclassified Streptomyces TaxID=2593676 RepID=UPI00325290D5
MRRTSAVRKTSISSREIGRPRREPHRREAQDARSSTLDALDRTGVRVLSSCRQGACGTCETPVLAG